MSLEGFIRAATQEFYYTARGLRRTPAFTITAILTVAVAIGASTAVFSVVDRVLFRPLPYYQDSRLVSVGITAPIERHEFMLGRQYFDWKDHQTPFEQMTSWSGLSDCDLTDQDPVRLTCARVESTFLSTFGVKPFIGRDFIHQDDVPGAPGVAIISYSLWRGRFGGERDVSGKALSLDGKPFRVIGVLPRDFVLPTLVTSEIVIPQQLDEAAQRRSTTGAVLSVFARLKSDVTKKQAGSQLQSLLKDFLRFVPPQFRNEVKLKLRSVRERQFQDVTTASWFLLGAVLALFMTGCANLTNLLIARAASREREMAVRSALGANRPRLALLALSESMALALAGGVAGCALAYALLRAFMLIAPAEMVTLQQVSIDYRVLAFTLGTSLLAGLMLGLTPVNHRLLPALLGGHHSLGQRRTVLRQALIIGQIAVSMLLVSTAGLLMQSMWNVESEPLGLDSRGVITAEITLNQKLYPTNAQQQAFFEQLESRLDSVPGVISAAVADSLPPQTSARSTLYASIQVQSQPRFSQGTGGSVIWRAVTPQYFSALQIPILRGRPFSEQDRAAGIHVIVLSKELAQRLFQGQDPIGKQMQVNAEPPWFTVVGIAEDVRNNGVLKEDEPEYYLLRGHAADLGLGNRMPPGALRHAIAIVRTKSSVALSSSWLAAEVHNLDPTVPIEIETMQQKVGELARRPRFNAYVMAVFAAISLLLACLGLYGLMSFLAVQRTREIGVRMALGATYRNIIELILGQAMRWTLLAIVLGATVSLAAARLIQSLLFHVRGTDLTTIATSAAGLIAVGALSAWGPAKRAAAVDPQIALRTE